MFLNDRLATLKFKEGDSLTQHIQIFRTIIAKLTSSGIVTSDEDAKLALMRSMPSSYRTFLTALRGDHTLTLQQLITYLI
jgi:hypothetical protein